MTRNELCEVVIHNMRCKYTIRGYSGCDTKRHIGHNEKQGIGRSLVRRADIYSDSIWPLNSDGSGFAYLATILETAQDVQQ